VDDLVKTGIALHDEGKYEQAIKTYEQALAIEANSALVNYEISLSYMSLKDYENALKYSSKVIDLDKEHLLAAYIVKGSSLDYLGRTEESIKLFEKGIKRFGDHHLLYYNLGYNHFQVKNYGKAESAFIKAIETNSSHASSHLLLGYVMEAQKKKVQSILALHHFLLLEPGSERAKGAYKLLIEQFSGNVQHDKDKPNQINIFISAEPDSEFGAAEMMLSMLEASKSVEENKGKSESELYKANTESFFKILGELKKKKNKGIFWELYVPFFYKIAKSPHMDTYCYYVSQSSKEESVNWLKANKGKVEGFANWVNDK
jgi:tetratricopeptide (TPR) repeat protein